MFIAISLRTKLLLVLILIGGTAVALIILSINSDDKLHDDKFQSEISIFENGEYINYIDDFSLSLPVGATVHEYDMLDGQVVRKYGFFVDSSAAYVYLAWPKYYDDIVLPDATFARHGDAYNYYINRQVPDGFSIVEAYSWLAVAEGVNGEYTYTIFYPLPPGKAVAEALYVIQTKTSDVELREHFRDELRLFNNRPEVEGLDCNVYGLDWSLAKNEKLGLTLCLPPSWGVGVGPDGPSDLSQVYVKEVGGSNTPLLIQRTASYSNPSNFTAYYPWEQKGTYKSEKIQLNGYNGWLNTVQIKGTPHTYYRYFF